MAEEIYRLVEDQSEPSGHGPRIVANPGGALADAASFQVLDHHLLNGLQGFALVGQYRFRPIADRLTAWLAVGAEDGDFRGMNVIQVQTALPVRIPMRSMGRIIEADRFFGEEAFRISNIPLDIRAGNCYSHLKRGASNHLAGHRDGSRAQLPYAANDEEAISLLALPRDGFSAFIAIIPAFTMAISCR